MKDPPLICPYLVGTFVTERSRVRFVVAAPIITSAKIAACTVPCVVPSANAVVNEFCASCSV